MNIYYLIKENRTKWYATIGVVSLLIFIFLKFDFWHGFSSEILIGVSIYFLVFLFRSSWTNRKRNINK